LPAKALPGVTGLPGGPHNLTNKTPRPGRSTPSVANTAGSDMQVIVAWIHKALQWLGTRDGSGEIDFIDICAKAPAGDFMQCSVTPSLPTKNARRQSALLSRLPNRACDLSLRPLPVTFGLAKTSEGLGRNATSIIGIASHLVDARTGPRHAAPAQTDLPWTGPRMRI